MKVLLVNSGEPHSPNSNSNIAALTKSKTSHAQQYVFDQVKEVILNEKLIPLTERQDLEVSVKCKSMYDLKEYVYDFEKKHADNNTDSIKRFDYLDFVVMDIDGSHLPWQKKCRDLQLLFNMCKMSNKPLLATGGGMANLVYYCATSGAKFKVVNGKEKGGPVREIKQISKESPKNIEKIIGN